MSGEFFCVYALEHCYIGKSKQFRSEPPREWEVMGIVLEVALRDAKDFYHLFRVEQPLFERVIAQSGFHFFSENLPEDLLQLAT